MRKLILIGLVLLLFVGTANASEITLDTLEYKQNKLITIPGNITMTPEGEGVSLLFRLYDPVSSITIYSVQSDEVEVTPEFINDTKFFKFLANDNNTYLIGVDYSSIDVPPSIDEIIAEYEALIDELEANNTRLWADIETLQRGLNASLSEISDLKEKNAPLLARIENLTNDIAQYEIAYLSLDAEKQHFQNKFNEYKDSWNVFPEEGFYFNFPTAIITAVLLFILFNLFTSRSQGKPTMFEGIKTIIFKQKPKVPYKEPTGSPRDIEELKKMKEGKK
jgi:hypothetical protein